MRMRSQMRHRASRDDNDSALIERRDRAPGTGRAPSGPAVSGAHRHDQEARAAVALVAATDRRVHRLGCSRMATPAPAPHSHGTSSNRQRRSAHNPSQWSAAAACPGHRRSRRGIARGVGWCAVKGDLVCEGGASRAIDRALRVQPARLDVLRNPSRPRFSRPPNISLAASSVAIERREGAIKPVLQVGYRARFRLALVRARPGAAVRAVCPAATHQAASSAGHQVAVSVCRVARHRERDDLPRAGRS
jgi:hypothetical protein